MATQHGTDEPLMTEARTLLPEKASWLDSHKSSFEVRQENARREEAREEARREVLVAREEEAHREAVQQQKPQPDPNQSRGQQIRETATGMAEASQPQRPEQGVVQQPEPQEPVIQAQEPR